MCGCCIMLLRQHMLPTFKALLLQGQCCHWLAQ
jgi:hypothetical protein